MRRLRPFILLVALVSLVAGCRSRKAGSESANAAKIASEKKVSRTITLYYESPALVLMPESRAVDLPETPTLAASQVLTELFRGPSDSSLTRVFPEDATVRAVYFLPDGNAVVDLGGPTLSAGWNTGSHMELMAVYSLIQTMVANFSDVKRVRILVNGQPYPSLAGHVAIDRFLPPSPSLVGGR